VPEVPAERVRAFRAFTRFYTKIIGALSEGLLKSPYSLTEVRVMYELANRGATDAIELRRTLGLDASYLSRILTRFESDGMVLRARSEDDARKQVIVLTDKGWSTFDELDKRQTKEVAELLDRLTEEDQRKLVGSMATIQAILEDAPRPPAFVLRPLGPGDYGWIIHRHGSIYSQTYGWDATFESLVARIVADYVDNHDPKRENAWIAEVDGEPVGCVFCVRDDDQTARLRLLLVEPGARGLGIGGRLVEECVRFARRAGYERMVLWTNDVLHAARRIYERAGFQLVEEGKHHSWGADLVEQTWELDLKSDAAGGTPPR
jgi:DNA-binding MarR family transcriptional regulator/GNAT superfamily N-acetyltransferase